MRLEEPANTSEGLALLPSFLHHMSMVYIMDNTKKDIIRMVDSLDHDHRLIVLEALLTLIDPMDIVEGADGCRVNLDNIANPVVEHLHSVVINLFEDHKDNT